MNQHKKRVLFCVLLLMLCIGFMSGCIHLDEGEFPIMPPTKPSVPQDIQIPSEQTTPTETTPEVTIPDVTVPPVTTPPETTPEEGSTTVTTPEQTTPVETTPPVTTPPETTPPETTTEQPVTPPTPTPKIKIYIDQGHNPFSPTHPPSWNTGASNEALGLYEQDLTYEIGMLLVELLAQDDRFEVRVSRPTDETILGTDNDSALDFRVNDAAEWGADYFISLHTNSYTDSGVRGLEVYTAEGDDTGYAIGEEILNALAKSTDLRNRGMKDGSLLRVLKNAKMPAVLVEMGYLSNWEDAKLLDESPDLFAQGIYNGILSYFNQLEESPVTE